MNKSASKNAHAEKGSRKRGWYTAMYYFSEHIRDISEGAINYKVLYSLVGTKGHYVNHSNAAVRVSSAPELSRLIHSEHYAEDLERSHDDNECVFDNGAASLYTMLINLTWISEDELFARLSGETWKDVAVGFANEKSQGRPGLDLVRINREMQSLFEHYGTVALENRAQWLVNILSSYFHALCYGYIDVKLARLLAAETIPVVDGLPFLSNTRNGEEACLVRICGKAAIGGIWKLDPSKETTIGRYTDCDIAETAKCVSRLHCSIFRKEEGWVLKDIASSYGTTVIRGNERIALREGSNAASVVLCHGDMLMLASQACYWFGMLYEEVGGSFSGPSAVLPVG